MLILKISIFRAKLLVPSIGSMTHQIGSADRGGCLNIPEMNIQTAKLYSACAAIEFGPVRLSNEAQAFRNEWNEEIIALCRSLPESTQTDAILFFMKYVILLAHLVRQPWINKSQGGLKMKTRMLVSIPIFVLAVAVIFIFASCDNNGGVTPSYVGTWINPDYDFSVGVGNAGKIVITHVDGNDYMCAEYDKYDDPLPGLLFPVTLTNQWTDSEGNLFIESIYDKPTRSRNIFNNSLMTTIGI